MEWFFPSSYHLRLARDGVYGFILFFPLIFTFGFLPQIDTFIMYVLEQVDIHLFGGNATSSLTSSIYCILRSLIACGILIGFAYGGLTEGEAHSVHTQEILFSIFCALGVAISYHLSRSSSDPTVILSLIKRQLLVPTSEVQDVEEAKEEPAHHEVSSPAGSTSSNVSSSVTEDPLPKKLRETVNARLKSDGITCVFIAVLTFFIHWSGFFHRKLQPDLSYVLWIVAGVFGFLLHYILPQVRKELPWLCFSHPLLKSAEYQEFEVKGPAKVMWFEKLSLWLQLVEKSVIYPMIFLSALTIDIEKIKELPADTSHWWGSIILVVTALKTLR